MIMSKFLLKFEHPVPILPLILSTNIKSSQIEKYFCEARAANSRIPYARSASPFRNPAKLEWGESLIY